MFPLPGKLYTLSCDRINENVPLSFKLHIKWLKASQCNIKYNKSVLLNKMMSFVRKQISKIVWLQLLNNYVPYTYV